MTSPGGRVIVITGSTRGIGRGLAEAFLARDCKVVVCGRRQEDVESVVAALAENAPGQVVGQACDVTSAAQLEALWDLAVDRFGRVDLWVNNAGSAAPQRDFLTQDLSTIERVVSVNLTGMMLASHIAASRMQAQGHGALYNMEGFGSDGARQNGMALYGATKRALRYFTRSLADELRSSPVQICLLSPGVVVTELLLWSFREGNAANFTRQRWLFEIIADPPEVACAGMADMLLANRRSHVRLAWMTVPKAIWRALQPRYHRRRLFAGLFPEERG